MRWLWRVQQVHFLGALYTHAHVRALVRYVRTCVWKMRGVFTVPFVPVELFI